MPLQHSTSHWIEHVFLVFPEYSHFLNWFLVLSLMTDESLGSTKLYSRFLDCSSALSHAGLHGSGSRTALWLYFIALWIPN